MKKTALEVAEVGVDGRIEAEDAEEAMILVVDEGEDISEA